MDYLESVVDPKGPYVPDIDIVFVHGLNPKGSTSHARQTWTADNGVFWPEDLLCQELPTARILLFSYNSSILNNAADAHVSGHAINLCDRLKNVRLKEEEVHRPLVFVTHSLGGLLVKRALVEAVVNPRYRCLKASTQGLVFFATPHRGGENAGVAKFAANFYSTFTGQPRNDLLDSLKERSLITELSSDQFRHQLNDYEVLSFIETRKMSVKISRVLPAKKILIVDETSARLGCQQENHQNLDRDHSDICKFSGLDDKAYQAVGPNLRGMTDWARLRQIHYQTISQSIQYTSSVPGSIPSHLAFRGRDHRVTLPQRCNPFRGRDILMEEIQREWQKSTPRRISLSGLGGVGKTELSISVVEELGSIRYVLYLRASNDDLLLQDLETAAQDLRNELLRFESGNNRTIGDNRSAAAFYFSPVNMADLVSILKRWLRATPVDGSRILVVLDDLDGLEPSHQEQYSLAFSGEAVDLIYTTRDPSMADEGMLWPATKFEVSSLQVEEAVNVLEHISQDNSAARTRSIETSEEQASVLKHDTTRKAQMNEIVTRLGALPAAIIIGSHYVKDKLGSNWDPASYQKFLDLWNQDRGKSKILKSRRAMLRYHHSMLASFELSLDRLRRNVKDVVGYDTPEKHCLIVLQLLSAMDLHEISGDAMSEFKRALSSAWQHLRGNLREAKFSDVVLDSQSIDNGISIDECVMELVKVSLLTVRSTDRALLLNNVTQACALTVPNQISPDEKIAVENNAKEIWKYWNRSDSHPLDGHA